MEYIHKEFTRKKNLDYDVVVVGGGLAGLTAAIASARHGAKTAIIQNRPVFGGNASSEIRMHICGASENQKKPEYEEGGILHEIMLLNKSRNDSFNYSVWDMTLYEVVKSQQNLTAYLNTTMLDCEVSDGSIGSVRCYQLTTETFYTIHAQIFIDCTGIGTLAMKSGAVFMTGSEGQDEFSEPDAPDKHTPDRMGNTLLLKAVDRGHPVHFTPPSFARHFTEEELRFRPHSTGFTASVGDSSDYTRITTFSTTSVDYGYWWIELCGKTDDFFSEYEEIRDDLMSCVWGVWDHIKNGGDHGAENYDLEWVGILPGMREGRRIIGAEVFTPSFRAGHEPGLIVNGSARNGLFISNGVSDASEIIRIVPTRTISVDELRITFDSCFERAIKITLSDKRRAQQLPGVPLELVKDYRVELLYRGRKVAERMVEGNFERLNIIVFDGILTDEIRLAIFSTNGCPDARIFRIAAYGNEDR